MDVFTRPEEYFVQAIDRARALTGIQEYLETHVTAVLNSDDCLRAAVVQAVSSFDHLMHETLCAGVSKRLSENRNISGLDIPFSFLNLGAADQAPEILRHVRFVNSHKTFVDPAKMAAVLKHFDEHPWNFISASLGMSVPDIKLRQKQIYRWRNRIAHEADVNPANAGVDLFSIDRNDVLDAIQFVEDLGHAVVGFHRTV